MAKSICIEPLAEVIGSSDTYSAGVRRIMGSRPLGWIRRRVRYRRTLEPMCICWSEENSILDTSRLSNEIIRVIVWKTIERLCSNRATNGLIFGAWLREEIPFKRG